VRGSAAALTVDPRNYARLSDVMQDVVDARIYQGIHFRFADEVGRRQGKHIGRWTFRHYVRPVRYECAHRQPDYIDRRRLFIGGGHVTRQPCRKWSAV
jgi:hypothetical protein